MPQSKHPPSKAKSGSASPLGPTAESAELLEIEIEALAYGGSGAGRVAAGSMAGKRAFVPLTVPGERVRAVVTLDRDAFCEAEAVEWLRTSAGRVTPPCPYYPECGGCQLQHMEVGLGRRAKRDLVEATLRHHAGVLPRQPVALIGEDLPDRGYRRRAAFHVNEHGKIGFFRRKSRTVVEIAACLVAKPALNKALAALQPWLSTHPGLVGGVVIEEHDQKSFATIKLRVRPPKTAPLNKIFAELEPHFTALRVLWNEREVYRSQAAGKEQPFGHFFQVNEQANERLIAAVLQQIRGARVTELYAGAGNFSLPLAALGKEVEAVEADRELVEYGRRRAGELGLSERVTFKRQSVEAFLREGTLRETVLLDPPRSGSRPTAESCRPEEVRRIVYVSCNVATLARDVKILADSGYELEHVSVIDMFPHTQHIETVAVLSACDSERG